MTALVSVRRAEVAKSRARMKSVARRREALSGWLFASPWLIGAVFLTVGPVAVSILLSFTRWNLSSPPVWIGVDNYTELFASRDFHNSVQVTLTYVILGVPLFQIAGLAVAMLLNRKLPGIGIFRTILFLPAVLSGVAISVLWMQLLRPEGPVNEGLRAVGISDPPGWLSSPGWAIPAMVLIGLWSIGTSSIIYLAGLQNVPDQLYEVAKMDGAGPIRSFFTITLPLITPVLLFTLLDGVISAFQVFDVAYVLGGSRGGSGGSLSFYLLYMWNEGFRNARFGYASALAWVFVVFAAGIIIFIFKTSNRWVFDDSEES